MFTIAKVIVDVPSAQTDQSYDYIIPESLASDITIGYRVLVPFGKRQVLGFVVDIQLMKELTYPLKEIYALLDTYPVLNQELIQLGQYLSDTFYAFKVTSYLTMLPAMLKVNYRKIVQWQNNNEEPPSWFIPDCELSQITNKDHLTQLLKWAKLDWVKFIDVVEDRVKIKLTSIYYLNQENINIRKGAKQLEKLMALFSKSQIIDKETLIKQGITTATIKSAIEKGWIREEKKQVYRDPFEDKLFQVNTPKKLNDEQNTAFLNVKQSIVTRKNDVFLLEGVTGSGKTEVYMALIAEAIAQGRSALFLVPEISLTPQMVNQFKGRFGNRVAVLHSALSNGQRLDEWTKIRTNQADIVIGARSSVFAPLENIGIIIIDEEHESTYKQMDSVRYHARDVAIYRGEYHHAPVVLGSATPCLESRARAQKGLYHHLKMMKRANQQLLPEVTIVDMTKEKKIGNFDIFSDTLKNAIADRLAKNEQIVLFLNRRGYSSFLMCRDCGHTVECPNCDISLTYHRTTNAMKCHYCGHQEPIVHKCPRCQSLKIRQFGIGTQKIEEVLRELYPSVSIIRMDVDTTSRKGDHEKLLKRFEEGKAQILLGTQMIAKGLDFPNITLVGVINADTSLQLPDFRASEKTFQLLTQVSGRAGRGQKKGEVVVQTYNPDHYAIQFAKMQHYEQFYRREMKMRYIGQYPPYFYTTLISVSHQDEAIALKTTFHVKEVLIALLNEQQRENDLNNTMFKMIGPSAQSIARVNNRYYFQILLKYKNKESVQKALDNMKELSQQLSRQKIYLSIDVEPMNFI